MNKKEVLEIRKQFSPENCSITRIAGCYVDGEKEKRIERMMEKHGFSRRKAVKIVEETDDLRRGYHEYYSGETWGAAHNYDICLDVMRLGKDRVMHIIDTALAELIDK